MFLFDTLKKILSGDLVMPISSAANTHTPYTSVVDTLPFTDARPPLEPHPADAYTTGLHQERSLSLSNGTVIGHLVGQIAELLGSTQINAFDGLPNWLPSLTIRLTLSVAGGSYKATLLKPDGKLFQLTAPGSVETQVAVRDGKLGFSFEALPLPAQGLCYEITII